MPSRTAVLDDVPAKRRKDLERGMRFLPSLGEVMPADARGRVAEAYEEIQDVLRVPFVNFLFRALANRPETFLGLWRGVRPRAGTLAFERASDALRSAAAFEPRPPPAEGEVGAHGDLARIRAFTASIHYVLPKLLLVATAFDRMAGAPPEPPDHGVVRWFGVDAEAALPRGPAEGTERVDLLDPDDAERRVRELFEEIKERHQHPGVASYYRAMGRWPGVLEGLWSSVRQGLGSPQRVAAKGRVVALASALEAGLPGRGDAPPAVDADVRAVLAVFRFRLIPDLLLDLAVVRGALDGPGAPCMSPFSAAEPQLRD